MTNVNRISVSRDNDQLIPKMLFFILWPFGSWLFCLKYPKSRSSYFIFFLFSVLLCWHMSPYQTLRYDDFIGILEKFINFNINSSAFHNQLEDYFTFKEGAPKEIYEIILMYVVKFFDGNYHFFFALAAIPIALCQLRSMKFITSDPNFRNGTWFGFWLLVMFIFPRDIITVQNPRFATGFWLCVVGVLGYFLCGKNKLWILPIVVAPFCHSGLILFLALFIIYLFIPHKIKLIEICALCSIPFAFLDADLMSLIDVSFLPKNFQLWASIYLSDEAVSRYVLKADRAGFWWVQAFFESLMKFTYILMTYQMIKQSWKIGISRSSYRELYLFYLFIFVIINLIQFVPEIGARYYWFIRVISVVIWFKLFGATKKRTLYLLVFSCSFLMLMRYGYIMGGALAVTTDPDLFITPLPYLLGKGLFWDLGY